MAQKYSRNKLIEQTKILINECEKQIEADEEEYKKSYKEWKKSTEVKLLADIKNSSPEKPFEYKVPQPPQRGKGTSYYDGDYLTRNEVRLKELNKNLALLELMEGDDITLKAETDSIINAIVPGVIKRNRY